MRQEWIPFSLDESLARIYASLHIPTTCHFDGCEKEATQTQIRYYRSAFDGSEDVDQDIYCDEHAEQEQRKEA